MKLIELLTVVVIIAILASIGVPVVVKSGKKIKQKWYEINFWHEARLTAVINDDTPKSTFDYYMTNGANPQKYQWVIINPNASNP
jgi:Tfp pilus assembly protein FimT